jgi:16S rRNA (adenine1518-N6/adenine1519-N6)-dimethyltransferase
MGHRSQMSLRSCPRKLAYISENTRKSRLQNDWIQQTNRQIMQKIKAKKALGQNFLIDSEALSDIAGAIEISGKHIIEVGPGYGALTDHLLVQEPISLDLIELDRDMITILEEKYTREELTIQHIDVLKYIPVYESYSVIANIPYYITSPILFYFLYELATAPSEMVIMMQEEVGEKILE